MPIPYFRYVSYVDDGVCDYQCLNCSKHWYIGSGIDGWKHCPYCGIKLVGQLTCRDTNEPSWLFKLKQQDEKWHNFNYYKPNQNVRQWVIETRSCRTVVDGEISKTTCEPWYIKYSQSMYGITTLSMVVSQLRSLRRYEIDNNSEDDLLWKYWNEYRARIVDIDQRYHSTGSTIWQHGDILNSRLIDVWKTA